MKKLLRIAIVLLLTVAALTAATVHDYDSCIPLILDGDGWRTSITLVNLGSTPSSFQLSFLGERGFREAWPVTFTTSAGSIVGQSVTGLLDAGASVQIDTTGTGGKAVSGYAQLAVLSGSKLGANTRLVRSVGGKAESSVSIPLSPELEQKSRVPFLASESDVTELVLVSETMSTTLDLIFRDLQGKVLVRDTLTFGASAQLQIRLAEKYPELKGQRGTVEWSVSFPGADIYEDLMLSAVALNRSSSGVLSAIAPMTLPQDQGHKAQH